MPAQSTGTKTSERISQRPSRLTNCAEYRIYDATGLQVNQVIGNSDWSLAYIAEASGGADGSAVKVRDILPCAPGECVSYHNP